MDIYVRTIGVRTGSEWAVHVEPLRGYSGNFRRLLSVLLLRNESC